MIGAKRERVRILRRVRAEDANGNFDLVETLVAERWASVSPITGTENELAGQLRAVMKYAVKLDLFGVAITSDDKVMWLTRGGEIELNIYEIRLASVRGIDTSLICASGTLDGTVP